MAESASVAVAPFADMQAHFSTYCYAFIHSHFELFVCNWLATSPACALPLVRPQLTHGWIDK